MPHIWVNDPAKNKFSKKLLTVKLVPQFPTSWLIYLATLASFSLGYYWGIVVWRIKESKFLFDWLLRKVNNEKSEIVI